MLRPIYRPLTISLSIFLLHLSELLIAEDFYIHHTPSQLILTPQIISSPDSSLIHNLPRWLLNPPTNNVQLNHKIESLLRQHAFKVKQSYKHIFNSQLIAIPPHLTLPKAIQILQQSNLFSIVEPDYRWRAIHSSPNDPHFSAGLTWHLHNYGQNGGTPGAHINALQAWSIRHSAPSIIVAILDSGIRLSHHDLAPNLWTNPNEIPNNNLDDDANGYIDDIHGINAIDGTGNPNDDAGHGTHVAGIIGALGNNATGTTGVAWQIRLMPLKWLDQYGYGSLSDVLQCINYAIAKGAHILNNSWGTDYYSPTLQAAYQAAQNAGMLIVTAAGNAAQDVSFLPRFPGNFELSHLVNVAATNRHDQLSPFSNTSHGLVNLAAPGSDIHSTHHLHNNDYTTKSGTSMASPIVAAALALLKAHYPTDTPLQLINRLHRGTDPIPALQNKTLTHGRLNLHKALSAPNRPINDHFNEKLTLTGTRIIQRTNNHSATTELNEPHHASLPPTRSLWWQWTAPHTALTTLSTHGSTFDTTLALYTGTTLPTLTPIAANNNDPSIGPSNTSSRITFLATQGTTYSIAVDSPSAQTGLVLLRLQQLTQGFLLDGTRDSDHFLLSSPAMKIYAAIRGDTLYTATWSPGANATGGNDHFIFITDTLLPINALAPAPWAKAGLTAAPTNKPYLAGESNNNYAAWFNAPPQAQSHKHPINSGQLEGTLPLTQTFGSIPAILHIAAASYPTDDGTTLNSQGPPLITAPAHSPNNIEPAEFLSIPTLAIRDENADGIYDRLQPELDFIITSITPPNPTTTITWNAFPGKTYIVEYKDDLTHPTWTQIGAPITAPPLATTLSTTDTPPPHLPRRFYRIRLL